MSWPWRIVQLAGPKKIFEFTGWSAPFGRRRQDPIVTDDYERRTTVTRYADGTTTRHDLGGEHKEPWVLKGRFMDRELGAGGAEAKYRELKALVADAQPVSVTWGPFCSVTGFCRRVQHGIEAKTDISYELEIEVDVDDFLRIIPGTRAQQIAAISEDLLKKASPLAAQADKRGVGKGIEFGLGDAIDSLVSSVTGTIGQLNEIAGQIADIEKATAGQANRLIAGINQARTAVQSLRQTVQSARADAFAIRNRASDLVATERAAAGIDAGAIALLSLLALMQREAEIAERSRAAEQRVAKQDESWEGMSNERYGTPDRANDLRAANQSRFGGKPTPGETTNLPP